MKKRMVCPNGCNASFYTTGHVMQEWEVDEQGTFISVSEECIQVTHDVDYDNIWTCTKCGAAGITVKTLDELTQDRPGMRFLLVNDERGMTRLLGEGTEGVFDQIIDIMNFSGNKEEARRYYEQKYPCIKGKTN